jgi:small-conductance mechanosensitive channel
MEFVFVLAEGTPRVSVADWIFERYPPAVAIPAFILTLFGVGFVLEKAIVAAVRQVTSRTKTKVDDALADGLPSVLRPAIFLAGLHIAVNVVLREMNGEGSELTPMGRRIEVTLSILTIVVLTICLARVASRMVDVWVEVDPSRARVGPTVKFCIKLVAVPFAGLLAARVLEVQLSGVLQTLGLVSIAVGLALQDTLKNLAAGVQLVMDRPIRVGDFVEVDKSARGTVLEIGLRSTKIQSPENNTVIIPNAVIANAIVTNVDHTDRSMVQTFDIGVAYGSDTRRVQAVLEDVVAQAAKDLPGVLPEPLPVNVRDFGESSVNFTVRVRFRQFAGRLPLVTEVYHRIYARLQAEGIEIPYPTRTVHVRNDGASSEAASAPSSP